MLWVELLWTNIGFDKKKRNPTAKQSGFKKQQTMVNQMWQSYKLKGVSGSSSDMVLMRLN